MILSSVMCQHKLVIGLLHHEDMDVINLFLNIMIWSIIQRIAFFNTIFSVSLELFRAECINFAIFN